MLYHRDVWMPRKIRGLIPMGSKNLKYTLHAGRELNSEGIYHPPMAVSLDEAEVVEVSVNFGKVDKLVVRTPSKEVVDAHLVLAIIPTEVKNTWVVKTGWLNKITDTHKTLNVSAYVYNGKAKKNVH